MAGCVDDCNNTYLIAIDSKYDFVWKSLRIAPGNSVFAISKSVRKRISV